MATPIPLVLLKLAPACTALKNILDLPTMKYELLAPPERSFANLRDMWLSATHVGTRSLTKKRAWLQSVSANNAVYV